MADSDVKFTVVADTRAAEGELSDLEKAAERVQNAASRGGGGGDGGGGGGIPPRPGGEGEEFGKAAGKQIGRLIAAYMTREATGIVFRALRTPGKESPGLDMAQSMMQGALTWGTMGAMVGQGFGPKGAAIAGILGLIAGGGSGYYDAKLNERDKIYMRNQQMMALDVDDAGRERSLAAMKYMTAIGRLVEATPNRKDRAELIGNEVGALRTHLTDVTQRIKTMIAEGVNPNEGKFQAAMMQRGDLASRLQALETMKFKNGLQDPLAMVSAADYGDAFSKRGLYVGAQVDVGGVNERIAAANEEQVVLLRRIADQMTNIAISTPTYASPAAIESARQRQLGRQTWAPEIADTTGLDPESPAAKIISGGYRGGAIWTR